jgi:alcohol dehydrogenase class IV
MAVEAVTTLVELMGLPTTLSEVGADRGRIQAWAEAAHANRRLLDNTPRQLTLEDLKLILEESFED